MVIRFRRNRGGFRRRIRGLECPSPFTNFFLTCKARCFLFHSYSLQHFGSYPSRLLLCSIYIKWISDYTGTHYFFAKRNWIFVNPMLLWGQSCLLPTQPVQGHLFYHPGFFLSANKSAPMADWSLRCPCWRKECANEDTTNQFENSLTPAHKSVSLILKIIWRCWKDRDAITTENSSPALSGTTN